MAAALARFGIHARIIDKAVRPPDDRSRAIVLQARTLELFEDLGIVDEVLHHGLTMNRANFFLPSGRRGSVRFHPEWIESAYGQIVTLPQDETERILGELGARMGVPVERGVSLASLRQAEQGVETILQHADGSTERYDADWVIGCDGAHSAVRQLAGIPFVGSRYPNEGLLGDVDLDWDLPDGELSLCPNAEGLLLAFPLPGAHRFRIIMILPTTRETEDRSLSESEFAAQLARMTPGRVPRILTARWLTRYRLHHRGVPEYRHGHCFVAGDAAHIHSPVGAQGMNTGIQDAVNLAWKLALVVRGEAPAWLLDTYHDERHRVGKYLLENTDRAFAIAAGGSWLSRTIRRVAPALAIRALGFPVVGKRITRFVSQTRIRYRASRLSTEGRESQRLGRRAPRAGDRVPDVILREGQRLFQLLDGSRHTLLLFAASSLELVERLAAIAVDVERQYGALVHPVILGTVDLPGRGTHLDGAGRAHSRFGARQGAIYLVRPDGHVGYRGLVDDSVGLSLALSTRFIPPAPVSA
jgi:2-polyprenyl-6-methoxyphenol hydroxylase-like FAD-dependent oxidoreductase